MMHGLDVEEIISGRDAFNNVVVGEIVAIKPHPNADKLRLAGVVIAPGGQPQEIVCGAPNIEVGQKVPVALVGAKLPNGLTIESRAIRGVTSNGMICAEDELGLGQSHAGVMVLPLSTKVGTPFGDTLKDGDDVIDLAMPANRSDLMSMRGLAREIGVMLERKTKFPAVALAEGATPAEKSVTLEIADPKLCSLLTARVVRGVTMKPTPAVIVNRLQAAGMRSVNIIADITNYIMLEYGQPLHAYDASKVRGGVLVARSAKAGEPLKTLDGKTRTLSPEMLVIADAERAIGLAGVMGGEDTEVTNATADIILEAAIFNPVSIRKTSRHLGLMSEASKRFEKGLWPSLPAAASAAAAAMMVELCGGTIEQGIVESGKVSNVARTVTLNPKYISERLGMTVSATKAKKILTTLGFEVNGIAAAWKVTVPEWRLDVALPEDIVDEVGRMVGYEKLPKIMPAGDGGVKDLPPMNRFKEEVKNILVDLGMTEIISHAFYGESEMSKKLGEHIAVANPLDTTQQLLRKSLLPQMVTVLKQEADAGRDAAVFEIGRVFDQHRNEEIEQQQPWKIAVGVTRKVELGVLASYVKKIAERLDADVHPEIAFSDQLIRGRRLEYFELELADLMAKSNVQFGAWDPERHIVHDVKYREPSKYPPITRDISFWWTKGKSDLIAAISDFQTKNPLLWETLTKDEFKKDGRTSFLISFIFQSPERTLTKTEIDAIMVRLESALKKLGATIR